jgi:hypothetical protein
LLILPQELKAEAALRAKVEAEKAALREKQHEAELKAQAEAAKSSSTSPLSE